MPYKTFANNQLLTAQEVNDYLMRQTLISVNDQAERDSIPAPVEGMRVYREDTNREERWNGVKWMAQPGIETRRYAISRSAVPTGLTAYYLPLAAETVAYKSDAAPAVSYSAAGADAGTIQLDAGLYMLTANVFIDWSFAGAQGEIDFLEYGQTAPFGQSNFAGNQFTTLTAMWLTDGTKRFGVWGKHNSGANRNLTGTLDIVRLRGI